MNALTKRESFLLLDWVKEKVADLDDEMKEGTVIGYDKETLKSVERQRKEWLIIKDKIKSRAELLKDLVKV